MLGFWIGIGIAGILILLAFIKANLRICHPNEILVFSGRKRTLKDGTAVGYRVIKGGRGLKIPIIESVTQLPLTTMPIDLELTGALSKGVIPINIQAMANVKIAGSEEEGLSNALERFLGKNINDISQVAKENIEGSLRGALATLTPEEANSDRLEFAEKVAQQARSDLKSLGLVLDTFKIKHISDNVEAENNLRVKKADLATVANRAEAKAKVASDIAKVGEEQKLEEKRVEMNKRRYEADVIVPAKAEKEAKELNAIGEAARIAEDGKATAEAVRVLREQWEKEDTRELFLIQQLPDILDKVTKVVSDNLSIDKVTIVDSGDGHGIPAYVKGVTGSIVAIFEQIKMLQVWIYLKFSGQGHGPTLVISTARVVEKNKDELKALRVAIGITRQPFPPNLKGKIQCLTLSNGAPI
jgi:flotillin